MKEGEYGDSLYCTTCYGNGSMV